MLSHLAQSKYREYKYSKISPKSSVYTISLNVFESPQIYSALL